MHDRFAINEIEPLNLKTRVREIERDEEREIIDLLGLFFLECRDWCELIFYSASISTGEATDLEERKKSLFGREMVNLGNTIRFLQHLGDYQS